MWVTSLYLYTKLNTAAPTGVGHHGTGESESVHAVTTGLDCRKTHHENQGAAAEQRPLEATGQGPPGQGQRCHNPAAEAGETQGRHCCAPGRYRVMQG